MRTPEEPVFASTGGKLPVAPVLPAEAAPMISSASSADASLPDGRNAGSNARPTRTGTLAAGPDAPSARTVKSAVGSGFFS